jgi:hypothetical protein
MTGVIEAEKCLSDLAGRYRLRSIFSIPFPKRGCRSEREIFIDLAQ